MTNSNLTFLVHNHNLAPSYSVPALEAYQSQKNIQVVSNMQTITNSDALCFGKEKSPKSADEMLAGKSAFFNMRLEMALGLKSDSERDNAPSYFPGAIIPGPGGAACSEVTRGNLLFDQFQYLLTFDSEMRERLVSYQNTKEGTVKSKSPNGPSRLFCREQSSNEAWLWHHVPAPQLYFLHQASGTQTTGNISTEAALKSLVDAAASLFVISSADDFSSAGVFDILSLISNAWFNPHSNIAPVTWGETALKAASHSLRQHKAAITNDNLLPFLFELEAMASHISLGEERSDRQSFARGVFAGNYIEVSMAPISSLKATEFCVRERLFDEVINLSSRGFAPVVINEYGLVADGNHRLTAAYVWNILKYCQDLEWSLENEAFQKRVADFDSAVQNGLLQHSAQVSPVTLHQSLNHLAYFLCRPDHRARLNSYTKPLLKRHDFISELPVVVLPEYLSGAVVKSLYDDGESVERACPSIYEAMSLNNHLVLPPRASYHFTDAALLPWFTVLKTSCGTKRRTKTFGSHSRTIAKR